MEELKRVIPDLDEILVDATEQKIQRPLKSKKKILFGKEKSFYDKNPDYDK
ncbi:MAG: hypothetical protein AB1465_02235 [Patescibacteria group bacterium]